VKDEFSFYNFPLQLTFEDYQEAEKEIVSHFARDPRVSSVYSFGSFREGVFDPGISDLDFLILVNEKEKMCIPQKGFFPAQEFQDSVTRYILMDQPAGYPVDEYYLEHFFYFLCNTTASLRSENRKSADPAKFFQTKQKEDEVFSLGIVVSKLEMLISTICFLSQIIIFRRVNVRLTLKILNGMKHLIKDVEFLGFAQTLQEDFVRDVAVLRKNWHSLAEPVQKEFLIKYSQDSLRICSGLLSSLDQFSRAHIFTSLKKDEGVGDFFLKINANRYLLFSDRLWNKKRHSGLVRSKKDRVDHLLKPWEVVILPGSLFLYFLHHSRIDGPLGRSIRSGIVSLGAQEPLGSIDVTYQRAFLKQAATYNHYWTFLSAKGFQSGIAGLTRLFYHAHASRSFRSIARHVLSFFDKRKALEEARQLLAISEAEEFIAP
jgi:hypothetical protein